MNFHIGKITKYIMAFNYISAAEAASLIKHGYNIGLDLLPLEQPKPLRQN